MIEIFFVTLISSVIGSGLVLLLINAIGNNKQLNNTKELIRQSKERQKITEKYIKELDKFLEQ
jgi:hypothetical protein